MSFVTVETTTQQHSGWDTVIGIAIVAVIIVALWLLNRLVMHFFPSTRRPRASIGNALMRVEATFLPGREHIMEVMERDEEENDEQGDPPHAGQ